jgi:hypothetical protein
MRTGAVGPDSILGVNRRSNLACQNDTWLLRGVDFDNDSAFMNDVVVPWCREQKVEVTRSRAYKKNNQAFVEQKNGAASAAPWATAASMASELRA